MNTSSNLSIIALRILPQCRDYIRKCLKENVFYYLNTNFDISDNGDIIKPRNRYVERLDDSFFDLEDKETTPNISISAVVGKNGDGKSSLIEFFIRMVNNFACRNGLNPHGHLIYVKGVYGELYYRFNNRFFLIRISLATDLEDNVEAFEYSYDEKESNYKKVDISSERKLEDMIFYTLVSNYSHFAYNTEEFVEEQENTRTKSMHDWENHWLHRVFHKTDAYQTPLNLHPFRERGNININKERDLSKQRLLTVIVKTFKKCQEGGFESEFIENGKTPIQLDLKDCGFSKFHSVSIKEYIGNYSKDNQFDDIRKSLLVNILVYEPNSVMKKYWEDEAIRSLNNIYNFYVEGNRQFFERAYNWLEKEALLKKNESIGQFLRDIVSERSKYTYDKISEQRIIEPTDWNVFSELSLTQLQRLIYILDICYFWKQGFEVKDGINVGLDISPDVLFKTYSELSVEEKAYHYLIYKTISIFETYDPYVEKSVKSNLGDFIWLGRELTEGNQVLYSLSPLFKDLGIDWRHESHITLKLKQTYNFLMGSEVLRDLYGKTEIKFKDMTEDEKMVLSEIQTLPPPIFKWDLVFHKENVIEPLYLSCFSSGEKQKLYFISAIVYHLQNISAVGEGRLQFNAVNLIFEEIELYFHPEWQRTLIFDLMKAIRGANIPEIHSVNMIFVTHSPYILSDIPKSNVLFLKDGMPTYEMQENTFGANINSLLKNGFFLPSLPMGEFAYRKINTLFAKLHAGNVDSQNLDQLYAQIMTVGEPAIRMQLLKLFTPFKLFDANREEIALFVWDLITKKIGNASD